MYVIVYRRLLALPSPSLGSTLDVDGDSDGRRDAPLELQPPIGLILLCLSSPAVPTNHQHRNTNIRDRRQTNQRSNNGAMGTWSTVRIRVGHQVRVSGAEMISSQRVIIVSTLGRCLRGSVAEWEVRINVLAKAFRARRVQTALGVLDQTREGPVVALGDRHNHLDCIIATVTGNQIPFPEIATVVDSIVALSERPSGPSRVATGITDRQDLDVVAVDLEQRAELLRDERDQLSSKDAVIDDLIVRDMLESQLDIERVGWDIRVQVGDNHIWERGARRRGRGRLGRGNGLDRAGQPRRRGLVRTTRL